MGMVQNSGGEQLREHATEKGLDVAIIATPGGGPVFRWRIRITTAWPVIFMPTVFINGSVKGGSPCKLI